MMLCIFNGINNKTSQKSQKVQLCQLETFKVEKYNIQNVIAEKDFLLMGNQPFNYSDNAF